MPWTATFAQDQSQPAGVGTMTATFVDDIGTPVGEPISRQLKTEDAQSVSAFADECKAYLVKIQSIIDAKKQATDKAVNAFLAAVNS